MRDFTKIEAWRLADDLAVAVYQQTRSFPREELYGLTSQIRRSCSSVAANITEGAARDSKKDYLHFLHIARRSLAETQYFVHLAHRLGYLTENDANALEEHSRHAFACLLGLIKAVEKDIGQSVKFGAAVTALFGIGPSSGLGSFVPGPSSLVL